MKSPFYESKTSFKYTIKENRISFSENQKSESNIKYEIYGSLDVDLVGEIHYEGKSSSKATTLTLKGKDVYKTELKETDNGEDSNI